MTPYFQNVLCASLQGYTVLANKIFHVTRLILEFADGSVLGAENEACNNLIE